MEYLSTKEQAKVWNMSISRVIRLANAGRVPEAIRVGSSWMFPVNTKKPVDKRRKENKNIKEKDSFHFPINIYAYISENELETVFTEDERVLHKAALCFVKGDMKECSTLLEELQKSTQDRYVRFGVMYYLCLSNIFLFDFEKACQYYRDINLYFATETLHRHEIEFIIKDLEVYFNGNHFYADSFALNTDVKYSKSMYAFLLVTSAYSDFVRVVIKSDDINSVPYEIICQSGGMGLSPCAYSMLCFYTALLSGRKYGKEHGIVYLRNACQSLEENGLEACASFLFHYFKEYFADALIDNPEMYDRLTKLSEKATKAFYGLLEYRNKNDFFSKLNSSDYQLLEFAKAGLTHKEISAILNISVVSISKKYAALYEKTGVHNKHELADLLVKMLYEY